MGIQVGFYLEDLKAAANKAGAKIDVVLIVVPDSYEEWEDYDTGEIRNVFVPGGRDDRIMVTLPDGRGFLFSNTFDTPKGVRVWFSNKNVNDQFRDLLDELKVPYDRG